MSLKFIPREVFHAPTLPRSYFLGHHARAVSKIKKLLGDINLVLEIRDARAPLTTRNKLFEDILRDKPKIIVYTKADISAIDVNIFKAWHPDDNYCFINTGSQKSMKNLMAKVLEYENLRTSFFTLNTMVTGMPNVGKSSLINALRYSGTKKGKAARTGALAGVTRSIGTFVRIHNDPDIMIYDTPGISLPTTLEPYEMLVLTAIGSTNTTLVDPVVMADFLLFTLNKLNPSGALYSKYSPPTNDIEEFLENYSTRMGRLLKGGYPDLTGSAIQWANRWRNGEEGKIVFDDVTNPRAHEEWKAVRAAEIERWAAKRN
ncbi:P-loop containing nucleoside triphosphate hydrolase protein [Dipodascopsis uninucleata]